jgi:hypothetical protein
LIPGSGERLLELLNVTNGFAANFLNVVATLNTGCSRSARRIDSDDDYTPRSRRYAKLLGKLGRQILDLKTLQGRFRAFARLPRYASFRILAKPNIDSLCLSVAVDLEMGSRARR